AEALVNAARDAGCPGVKIGVVYGDDLMPQLESFAGMGIDLRHFETGASQKEIPGPILSANAYFGAFPIAEALDRGADIVVTGRVNDADRKSTRLNSSHVSISYAVFCLKKKKKQ